MVASMTPIPMPDNCVSGAKITVVELAKKSYQHTSPL